MIDLARHGLWVDSRFVTLTKTEFIIAELLCLRPGMVRTRGEIADLLCNYDSDPRDVVDPHIRRLRRKGMPIVTHIGQGFSYQPMTPDAEREAEVASLLEKCFRMLWGGPP
jgi:DNA-binding response OmpR family regulator